MDENATHANQFDLYLFTKKLQGDIVGIYDENATLIASYVYDAWGNHTVTNYTSENIGNINPFRYRGYYFDSETGFYYLNTRLGITTYNTIRLGKNSINGIGSNNKNAFMYLRMGWDYLYNQISNEIYNVLGI